MPRSPFTTTPLVLLSKLILIGQKHALEWASYDHSGWARRNHAVHFDTKEKLAPALSADAIKFYERIHWNGNNGWHDDYGKRDALRNLRRLREIGEFDPDDLAGYTIGRHGNTAIRISSNPPRKSERRHPPRDPGLPVPYRGE